MKKWRWALAGLGLGFGFGLPLAGRAAAPAPPPSAATPAASLPSGSATPPATLPATPPAPTAAPAAPIYQVELIVFRVRKPIGAPEDWSLEARAAGFAPPAAASGALASDGGGTEAATMPTSPSTPTPTPAQRAHVHPLGRTAFTLVRTAARLRESRRYSVLAHVAWTQTATPWGHPLPIPIKELGLHVPGLRGTVALERGQFLHVVLRLAYTEKNPPPALDATPNTVFVLEQSHRVHIGERDYFDHPAFGVIALVTATKTPSARAPVKP